MGYAFSSLDELGEGYGFRKIRRGLGVTAFGANALVMPPGYDGFLHFHDTQDELYFVHRGTARFGVDSLIERHVDSLFPWSTFAINVSGCFLNGLLVALVVDALGAPAWAARGLIVGFLGAYTTFSTYAQESHDLFVGGHVSLAVVNATGSFVVGILAVAAGTGVGRML